MKFLSTIIFICSTQFALGQATLTGANSNPIPGDVFTGISTAYQSEGNSGANVVWDFHSLTSMAQPLITRYVECDTTPACSYFTGSNLSISYASIGGSYLYLIANDDSLRYTGRYYAPGHDTTLFIGSVILKYPFTFNSVYAGQDSTFKFTSAVPLEYQSDVFTYTCDGFGTLILPTGTYSNTLRIRRISTGMDSVLSGSGPSVLHYTDTTYSWFTPDFHHALLMDYRATSTSSQQPGVTYYDSATNYFALGSAAAVSFINKPSALMSIYPNPTTELLNINFTLAETSSVSITLLDLLGKEIATINDNTFEPGEHNLTYNTSSLPKGLYLVQLKSNTGIETQRIIVN